MNRYHLLLGLLGGLALLVGCGSSYSARASQGIVFYAPGAGNWDLTDDGFQRGLRTAGYEGEFTVEPWTVSLNPAIDQLVKVNARTGGANLARRIEAYQEQYPGRPVTVVGLSAGTGVAVFAMEELEPGTQVDNVILLSSSLSSRYDLSDVVPKVKGGIYNYYSPQDTVLQAFIPLFGNIDGGRGQPAGLVGLQGRGANGKSVANIRWRREWQRYGYVGGHTDVTSARFVKAVLAQHVNQLPAHAVLPTREDMHASAESQRALAVLAEHRREDPQR